MKKIALIGFCVLLVACGGGGGNSSNAAACKEPPILGSTSFGNNCFK